MSDLLISVKIPGQVWAWLTSEFGLEPNATLHDVVIRHKEVKTRAETAERERDAWKQEADDERIDTLMQRLGITMPFWKWQEQQAFEELKPEALP